MVKKGKCEFFNPELRLTKEEEAERKKLVRKLDRAIALRKKSKKEEAEYWARLHPLYSKPGCLGKWTPFVRSRGYSLSTVNGLIKRLRDGWEESGRKPKPRLNQPNSGRFTGPHLAFTDKPFPDGKEILEAAFLFTADEKEQFIEALRIIGPEEALGLIFRAVVEHVERMREGVTTRIPLESPFDRSDRMLTLKDDESL